MREYLHGLALAAGLYLVVYVSATMAVTRAFA